MQDSSVEVKLAVPSISQAMKFSTGMKKVMNTQTTFEFKKEIPSYCRLFKNDLFAFHRAIMFAYIETLILNGATDSLNNFAKTYS